MKKHKVIWYYIFTFIFVIILGGISGVILDVSIAEQYAISLAMAQLSPMCGLILLCLFSKDMSIFKKMNWKLNKKENTLWGIISTIIPFIIMISISVILSCLGKGYIPNEYNFKEFVIIVIASIIGCLGEEIGWRGFLLPTFNEKHSLFNSAIFTGILWGAWHLGKISLYGIIGYLLFVFMIVEFTIIMSWIYSKTKGNLINMVVFHLSINIASILLFTGRENIAFYLVGIIMSAIMCGIIILNNKELLRRSNT